MIEYNTYWTLLFKESLGADLKVCFSACCLSCCAIHCGIYTCFTISLYATLVVNGDLQTAEKVKTKLSSEDCEAIAACKGSYRKLKQFIKVKRGESLKRKYSLFIEIGQRIRNITERYEEWTSVIASWEALIQ